MLILPAIHSTLIESGIVPPGSTVVSAALPVSSTSTVFGAKSVCTPLRLSVNESLRLFRPTTADFDRS